MLQDIKTYVKGLLEKIGLQKSLEPDIKNERFIGEEGLLNFLSFLLAKRIYNKSSNGLNLFQKKFRNSFTKNALPNIPNFSKNWNLEL